MIDKFLEFEDKNHLFDLKVDNVKFWHICRFQIYTELRVNKNQIVQGHTSISKTKLTKRFFSEVKKLQYCVLKNPMLFIKQKDIMVINHQRRVKNGSYYDCLYTDLFLNELDKSYYVFETPYLISHYRPVRTKNIRYLDYIDWKFSIYKRIVKKGTVSNNENTNIIVNVLNSLNSEFKAKIDVANWSKKIIQMVDIYRFRYKQYEKIIEKVKPKMIIEVVSYNPIRLVINDIAKKKGIPTVELQHGTIGRNHVAYNFKTQKNLEMFPDYLFAFGQFWKDNARYSITQEKIKVVGWPYYEMKVNQYQNSERNEKENKLLFISQGVIGDKLSKLAVDLSKQLDLEKYKITYKLHPGEYARWKKEYPWLMNKDIDVIDNNNHDMHYYFGRADVQIGVSSTALFEGIGYGLDTYLYKIPNTTYYETLYKKGFALTFNTATELANLLENKVQRISSDIEYFWAKDSLKKMKNEINKILSEKNEEK